jgi:hypothetical protein
MMATTEENIAAIDFQIKRLQEGNYNQHLAAREIERLKSARNRLVIFLAAKEPRP